MRVGIRASGDRSLNRATYRCKAAAHLARVTDPVDQFVTDVVLGRLSRPDARLLLRSEPAVDTAGLSAHATALRVRLSELTAMFTDGAITGVQLAEGTAKLRQQITDVEVQLARAVISSPLVGFADSDDVRAAWEATTVSRRKAVVDTLMVVTLLPTPRGRRPGGAYFDPDSVRIEWRQ
jgi:site-specific DNA recombinase